MEVKSLSATSIKTYMGCPSRFLAEQSRAKVNSAPGVFGTALHAALEWWHKMRDEGTPLDITEVWTTVANKYLGPVWSDYHATGLEIVQRYAEHPYSTPNKVLSYEIKDSFYVKPSNGGDDVKVNYICDRVDVRADGSYEVVDYKSQWAYVSPQMMREMVQPILYACAIRRTYNTTGNIAVTYLMLRHDPMNVTTEFTDEDMDRFERGLSDIAAKILDDDNPIEQLNEDCGYCIRKSVCKTLGKAEALGWTPTLPLEQITERRAQAQAAIKANENVLSEIDAYLMAHMRANDLPEEHVGSYLVTATRSRKGKYDPVVVWGLIGEEALRFMTVGKVALDKEAKRKGQGLIDPEVRGALLESVQYSFGEPRISVEKVDKEIE